MKTILFSLFLIYFSILEIPAQVTYLQTIHEGQGGIEGLSYPKDIITDTAGRQVFITAYNCVTQLQKNRGNSFLFRNSIGYSSVNFPGLWNTGELLLDGQGRFLYVTGDYYLNIFRVDQANDSLIFISAIQKQDDLFIGSAFQSRMAIPSGDSLFYFATKKGFQNALHIFTRDVNTGMLTHRSTTDTIWSGGDDFIDMKCSTNGECIYTLTYRYNDHAAFSVFRRAGNYKLEAIQTIGNTDGITEPAKILISRDGRFLYLFGTQKVKIFSLLADGTVSFLKENDITECYKIAATKDDRFIYFGSYSNLIVMERNLNTGDLTTVQEIKTDSPDYTGISYLEAICLSGHDSLLYVSDTYNHRLHLFSRDRENGKIQFVKEISNLMDKVTGLGDASDIVITHDNKHVLTVCPSEFHNINIFKRDRDGYLEFSEVIKWEQLGPEIGATRLLALTPDDRNLYVISTNMFGIRHLGLDTATGNYRYISSYTCEETGLPEETDIKNVSVSPDSGYLYLSTFDHMITYEIGDSGKLKYLAKYGIHENGDNGLKGIVSFVQTPDNRYIYICSNSDYYPRGITVLRRKPGGSIEFVSKNQDIYASVILVSGDGRFIYAIGSKIYSFSADPATGELTLIQELDVESFGFPQLYKLEAAVMSPDSKSIIGLSRQGKAIVSLYRNKETGLLHVIEMKNYSNDMNYYGDGISICMSYDLKNMYLISPGYLSAYRADIPIGLPGEYFLCKDSIEIGVDEGYNYLWSTGETTRSIYVEPGNYSVQVTDSLGRKGFSSTHVSYYQLPVVLLYLAEPTSIHPWRLVAETMGGKQPYNYLWSDGTTDPWIFLEQADSGRTFSVIVTDDHGCITSDTIQSIVITGTNTSRLPVMIISPNPTKEKLNISVQEISQDWSVSIYNLNGELLYHSLHKPGDQSEMIDLSGFKSGHYLVKLVSGKNTIFRKIVRE